MKKLKITPLLLEQSTLIQTSLFIYYLSIMLTTDCITIVILINSVTAVSTIMPIKKTKIIKEEENQ